MCGCLFLNVCLCWVFCPRARLNECVDFCSGCRLSTGGKRSTFWSWWCLDRPAWCSHRLHTVTFPVRTSAVSGTAPRRPCLGKHSISTLTYLRSESDFLFIILCESSGIESLSSMSWKRCLYVCSSIFSCIFLGVVLLRLLGILLCLLERKRFFLFLNSDICF